MTLQKFLGSTVELKQFMVDYTFIYIALFVSFLWAVNPILLKLSYPYRRTCMFLDRTADLESLENENDVFQSLSIVLENLCELHFLSDIATKHDVVVTLACFFLMISFF